MLLQTPYEPVQGLIHQGTILYPQIQYAQADLFKLPKGVPLKDNRPFLMRTNEEALSQDNYRRYISPQKNDESFDAYFGHHALDKTQETNQCQFLSIRRPLSGEHLPVMVWIHGGGYVGGGGDVLSFDSTYLVNENQVIVVHVTYRLGLWGFLGDNAPIPPNLGMHDVIQALEWIQKYIEFFGGDPQNVTLFGQSAGGDLIAHLMAVKHTQSLFHKVIIQSAPFGLRKDKQALTHKMLALQSKCLGALSQKEMLAIQSDMLKAAQGFGLQSGMPFGVQYAYEPMPSEGQIEEAWSQRARSTPVLVGYNSQETSVFLPGIQSLYKMTHWPLIGTLLKGLFTYITSREVYFKGAKAFEKLIHDAGGHAYRYELSLGSKTNGLGAAHTMDLPLLFWNEALWSKGLLVKDIPLQTLKTEGMHLRKVWADFAKTGHLSKEDSSAYLKIKGKNHKTFNQKDH